MNHRFIVFALVWAFASLTLAQSPEHENGTANASEIPRCQVIPIAAHQVSFQIEGVEKFRWDFSDDYPRPFFYPFRGPSGEMLTRMGHPGAPDHDHHQSIWFANNRVNGFDFWANGKQTKIRQRQWYAYEDGQDEAIMGCRLDWIDPDGVSLMQQELIAAIVPMENNEYAMELQFTLTPTRPGATVELDKTNFAFLAIRVAKTISAQFGGGVITNSEGQVGEHDIFGKSARWVDYSGPVGVGEGESRISTVEGITCFDHPSNHHYPTPWHVRDDGWIGAAVNLNEGITLDAETSLTLRYLLHAHRDSYQHEKATSVHEVFALRPGFVLSKGTKPGFQYEIKRASPQP